MLTSLALWQSNDCPSASKATLMNMDKYFMWIHYERLHNHNKAKHNKTVCIFLGIYCMQSFAWWLLVSDNTSLIAQNMTIKIGSLVYNECSLQPLFISVCEQIAPALWVVVWHLYTTYISKTYMEAVKCVLLTSSLHHAFLGDIVYDFPVNIRTHMLSNRRRRNSVEI